MTLPGLGASGHDRSSTAGGGRKPAALDEEEPIRATRHLAITVVTGAPGNRDRLVGRR